MTASSTTWCAIELCVRWYLTYRLSYRDLSAMITERGVAVSHTTILRWVQHYVPEFERRWARFAKPINPSWRVDETSVPVQGRWNYLYRAVDRDGKSVHSLFSESRTIESAQKFFRQAVRVTGSWPEKINLDGNVASHRGLRLLGKEDSRWQSVTVRARRDCHTSGFGGVFSPDPFRHIRQDNQHNRRVDHVTEHAWTRNEAETHE
ncbi:MAG: IS6 family transposase [Steroidobacteraceae bacterium]